MQYTTPIYLRFHERYAEFKRQCGHNEDRSPQRFVSSLLSAAVELAIAATVPQVPMLPKE